MSRIDRGAEARYRMEDPLEANASQQGIRGMLRPRSSAWPWRRSVPFPSDEASWRLRTACGGI